VSVLSYEWYNVGSTRDDVADDEWRCRVLHDGVAYPFLGEVCWSDLTLGNVSPGYSWALMKVDADFHTVVKSGIESSLQEAMYWVQEMAFGELHIDSELTEVQKINWLPWETWSALKL